MNTTNLGVDTVAMFYTGNHTYEYRLKMMTEDCTDEGAYIPAKSMTIYGKENIQRLYRFLKQCVEGDDK